jgi:hypothetical protein
MKLTLLRALQAIGIGILVIASPLCAQVNYQFTMQVPVDFSAANQQFSAGEYTIQSDISTGTVIIRKEDGPGIIVATFSAGENKDYAHARLVFHRYGTNVFLSQLWPAGATGRELIKSRAEAEMAKTVLRPEILLVIASGHKHRATS